MLVGQSSKERMLWGGGWDAGVFVGWGSVRGAATSTGVSAVRWGPRDIG